MNLITLAASALLVVASVYAPARAADEKPIKIILLGGQSNMVGVGDASKLAAPYDKPFPDVTVWNARTSQWEPVAPDTANPDGRFFGPEISFARAIHQLMPDDDVRLVKYAVGGSSLHGNWSPSGGPQYKAFMETARAALADLDKAGMKYEVVGMLWLQGESDAADGKGPDYQKNLTDFIAHMREQFKNPDMPFVIARVRSYYGRKNGGAHQVRAAQVAIAEADKRVECFDTDDCSMANPGHYDGNGLLVIGNRFAESYAKLFKAEK